jgi:arylsulfatase A-like enzyme
VRKVRSRSFDRINAIEKLLNLDGYRVAINDFTVAEHLLPTTPKTTIDEGVPSVDTDLCSNVRGLEQYLDASAGDSRPVFGYFAPMNVHILNTRRRSQHSLDGDYPGFYAPYASRLKRIDACFGTFVAHLKARGRYEDSIIVLTSDHGDSLGENGYWGHAMWLFPEDVRIPLIVHVPESLKPGLTTDLARMAFSTDVAPTLYTLLGHDIQRPNPLFGEPLFVPADRELSDRRRQSFLLTSSYGATYGLLRRNGRLLYVSDLVEWSESAYDLSDAGGGKAVTADADMRRLNQGLIRQQVSEVAAFYRFSR